MYTTHLHRFLKGSLTLTLALSLAACDLFGGDDASGPVTTGVFVANQGNFSDGNGSVTVFDPDTGANDAAAIDGFGAIVQSLWFAGGRLYVAANSANRIDVYDAATLARTGQIDDVVSPRYAAVDGDRAFVTDLFASATSFSGGKVSLIDLHTGTMTGAIAVGDNPEGLALAGGRLYVANTAFGEGTTLSVIDPATLTIIDTIETGCDGPRTLLAGEDDDVFVFCTGKTIFDADFNVVGETDGAVVILDGVTGSIVSHLDVDGRIQTVGPGQDAFFAPDAHAIFFVQDQTAIRRIDTSSNQIDGTVVSFATADVGAVAFDDTDRRLYVGHVAGFTESGTVTIHDEDGTQVGSFVAGIAPTYIAFRRDGD